MPRYTCFNTLYISTQWHINMHPDTQWLTIHAQIYTMTHTQHTQIHVHWYHQIHPNPRNSTHTGTHTLLLQTYETHWCTQILTMTCIKIHVHWCLQVCVDMYQHTADTHTQHKPFTKTYNTNISRNTYKHTTKKSTHSNIAPSQIYRYIDMPKDSHMNIMKHTHLQMQRQTHTGRQPPWAEYAQTHILHSKESLDRLW